MSSRVLIKSATPRKQGTANGDDVVGTLFSRGVRFWSILLYSRKIIFYFQQKSEEGGFLFFGEVFVKSIQEIF